MACISQKANQSFGFTNKANIGYFSFVTSTYRFVPRYIVIFVYPNCIFYSLPYGCLSIFCSENPIYIFIVNLLF